MRFNILVLSLLIRVSYLIFTYLDTSTDTKELNQFYKYFYQWISTIIELSLKN